MFFFQSPAYVSAPAVAVSYDGYGHGYGQEYGHGYGHGYEASPSYYGSYGHY